MVRGKTVILWQLLILWLGVATPASAAITSLLINGKSIHHNIPAGVTLNENNWGGGVQIEYDPLERNWIPFFTASGFVDSNSNQSYYSGGGIMRRYRPATTLRNFHIDAGVVGFMMTRKTVNHGQPFPGVLPALSIGTRAFALNVSYIPQVHPDIIPAWFFQFRLAVPQ